MTLDDLQNQLTNKYNFTNAQVSSVLESTIKLIAFKYEAELFKVFSKSDIAHANQLDVEESNVFFKTRYQEITGKSSDLLRDQITDDIVSAILANPEKYFTITNST